MATLNKAARNEQRKITATAFNNIAVSFVVTGIVVPMVNMGYQMTLPRASYWAFFGGLWGVAGTAVARSGTIYSKRTRRMTSMEIYGLVAPVVVVICAGFYALWISKH
jgi:uncharacterized membrane protein YdcZ (DUF606 family)